MIKLPWQNRRRSSDAERKTIARTGSRSLGEIDVTKSVIATGTSNSAKAGTQFNGTVAYFKDLATAFGSASNYKATIDWGDNIIAGDSSAGVITANSSGGFQVSASHTYEKPGTYIVLVTISKIDSSTGTADEVSVFTTITVDPLDSNPFP